MIYSHSGTIDSNENKQSATNTKKYHINGEEKKLICAIPSQNDVYTGDGRFMLFLELGEGCMDWAHLVNTYGAVHLW